MKKAFSLIELIITIVILSILIGIVFQTYIAISHIAVKIQNERSLHSELIYMIQTIQNIVDEGTVELAYGSTGNFATIESQLTLSGVDYVYTFEKQDNTLVLERQSDIGSLDPDVFVLSDPTKITINEFYVKVLPSSDSASYANKIHDGFWLFLDVQTPNYDPEKRWWRVQWNMQTFFNIRKYD